MSISNEDDDVQHSTFHQLEAFQLNAALLVAHPLSAAPSGAEEVNEAHALSNLTTILDEYQEQPYLLDPHLEALLSPVLDSFRQHIKQKNAELDTKRLSRVSHLIYFFTKVRGHKTIVSLFPHEVSDLSTLLSALTNEAQIGQASWQTRYILLLWLSLVCRLPFALGAKAGETIERLGTEYLGASSKESEGAVCLLGRFYSRQDAQIEPFLTRVEAALSDSATTDAFASSLIHVLSDLLLLASPTALHSVYPAIYHILATCDDVLASAAAIKSGTVLAKYRVKLAGRLALLSLTTLSTSIEGEESEVSGEVEVIIQEMMEALSNKDTIVRFSAAKYLARIAEKLPGEMADQLAGALLEMFEAGFEELDSAERVLQGCCFAFAELARRGKVAEELVGGLIECALKALLFDRKRGVQSIGSNVRDSAAYVLWSLSRALPAQLAAPHASTLQTGLVNVALFDRDIHIRRAASAAYQEAVGRWGVFEEGIAVLRLIDFFTISVRKRSFLTAAPSVAQFGVYREGLRRHLVEVGVRHYDAEMRMLSAQALGEIVKLDAEDTLRALVDAQIAKLATKDVAILHGTILSLAALASAATARAQQPTTTTAVATLPSALPIQERIFTAVTSVPLKQLTLRSSAPLLLSAALQAIQSSATPSALQNTTAWRAILRAAADTEFEDVHGRAADAFKQITSLGSQREEVAFLRAMLDGGAGLNGPGKQRYAARILGGAHWVGMEEEMGEVVDRLVALAGIEDGRKAGSVEGKRAAIDALSEILAAQGEGTATLGEERFEAAFEVFLKGLEDYTVDQRGDVGSWIRLASLAALKRYALQAISTALTVLNQEKLDQVIAGMCKQAVEKLDNVREVAGVCLSEVARAVLAQKDTGRWILRGGENAWRFASLRERERGGGEQDGVAEWRRFDWAQEKLLPLLAVKEYRGQLLQGAVLGVSAHAASSPLFDYATSLTQLPESEVDTAPAEDALPPYALLDLMRDLVALGKKSFSQNRVFIPLLHALQLLLEGGAIDESLSSDSRGTGLLKETLALATRNLDKIKSAPRLTAAAKVAVSLVLIEPTREIAAGKVAELLRHKGQPWVRATVAEEMFDQVVSLQGLGEREEERLGVLLGETGWREEEEERNAQAEEVARLLAGKAE